MDENFNKIIKRVRNLRTGTISINTMMMLLPNSPSHTSLSSSSCWYHNECPHVPFWSITFRWNERRGIDVICCKVVPSPFTYPPSSSSYSSSSSSHSARMTFWAFIDRVLMYLLLWDLRGGIENDGEREKWNGDDDDIIHEHFFALILAAFCFASLTRSSSTALAGAFYARHATYLKCDWSCCGNDAFVALLVVDDDVKIKIK